MVTVPRSQQVRIGDGTAGVDTVSGQAPAEAWKRLSAGAGAKGPRLYDWVLAGLPAIDDSGRDRWVLIRCSIADPDDPADLAFYLCAEQAGTTIDTLVRIAGTRWAVEECCQQAKTETGLDHYQVGSGTDTSPWPCSPTPTSPSAPPSTQSSSDLVALSPGEIRRRLAHLIRGVTVSFDRITAWAHLRRRYQARARKSHYQRRQKQHRMLL